MKALFKRSGVNVKREGEVRSNFTFTHNLSYIASVRLNHVKVESLLF